MGMDQKIDWLLSGIKGCQNSKKKTLTDVQTHFKGEVWFIPKQIVCIVLAIVSVGNGIGQW